MEALLQALISSALEASDPDMEASASTETCFCGEDCVKAEKMLATREQIDLLRQKYDEGLAKNPNDLEMLLNRSLVFLKLDKFKEALKDCEASLKIDPNSEIAYSRKTRALIGLKKFEEAISCIREIIKMTTISDSYREKLKNWLNQLNSQLKGDFDIAGFESRAQPKFHDFIEYVGPVKIVEIPNKGRGLIATEDIKSGSLVMASRAFAFKEYPVDKFTSHGVQKARATAANHLAIQNEIAQMILDNPEVGKVLYQLYAGPELGYLNPDNGDDCSLVDKARIEFICLANVFSCWTSSSQTVHPSGLWILPSYINHSCSDCNCLWMPIGNIMFVRAFRDIPKGSEVLISYTSLLRSYSERRFMLKFECHCRLCEIESRESVEVHAERGKIMERHQHLSQVPYLDPIAYNILVKDIERMRALRPVKELNFRLMRLLDTLAQFYFTNDQHDKSIKLQIEVHTLLKNTSMSDFVIESACNVVYCYLLGNQRRKAQEWADILKNDCIRVYGSLKHFLKSGAEVIGVMKKHGINFE